MDFKNGVINIQTAGYNGVRTVYETCISMSMSLLIRSLCNLVTVKNMRLYVLNYETRQH